MNTRYKQLRAQVTLKRLLQFFFQGLIVLAPIAVTLWVVLGLFQWVDGFLPNLIKTLFPSALDKNLDGSLRKITGLGFIVLFLLVNTIYLNQKELISYFWMLNVFFNIVHKTFLLVGIWKLQKQLTK